MVDNLKYFGVFTKEQFSKEPLNIDLKLVVEKGILIALDKPNPEGCNLGTEVFLSGFEDYKLNPDVITEIYNFYENRIYSNIKDISINFFGQNKPDFSYNEIVQRYESMIDINSKIDYLKKKNNEINLEYLDGNYFDYYINVKRFYKNSSDIGQPIITNISPGSWKFDFNDIDIPDLESVSNYGPLRRMYFDFINLTGEGLNQWKTWVFNQITKSSIVEMYLTGNLFGLFKEQLFFLWSDFEAIKIINEFIFTEFDKVERATTKNKKISNKQTKTLKQLFVGNDEEFQSLLGEMIDKKIVSKTKTGFEINFPVEFKLNRGRQHFICSLGYCLQKKEYLPRFCEDIEIVEALNHFFENVNISKQNYNAFKDSPKREKYLKYTSFLSNRI